MCKTKCKRFVPLLFNASDFHGAAIQICNSRTHFHTSLHLLSRADISFMAATCIV